MANGQQWTRVTGANLNLENANKAVANKARLASASFIKACENVGLTPTTRQASKWNNKRGLAYNVWNNIVEA